MKTLKLRPLVGGLDEAMSKVVEVESQEGLLAYLRGHYRFWKPSDENVTFEPYGFDERIGWDTHLVCVDGKAALYADGPPPWRHPAASPVPPGHCPVCKAKPGEPCDAGLHS